MSPAPTSDPVPRTARLLPQSHLHHPPRRLRGDPAPPRTGLPAGGRDSAAADQFVAGIVTGGWPGFALWASATIACYLLLCAVPGKKRSRPLHERNDAFAGLFTTRHAPIERLLWEWVCTWEERFVTLLPEIDATGRAADDLPLDPRLPVHAALEELIDDPPLTAAGVRVAERLLTEQRRACKLKADRLTDRSLLRSHDEQSLNPAGPRRDTEAGRHVRPDRGPRQLRRARRVSRRLGRRGSVAAPGCPR